MNRDYVIICNKGARSYNSNMLLFWGTQSEDDQPRSYGGYTYNLDACERYTKEELVNVINTSHYKFPFLEYFGNDNWKFEEHFFARIDDLEKLGYKRTTVMMK